MHVLVIPWTFPGPGDPLAGVFFRDQARALRRRGLRVGVVAPDPRRLGRSSTSGLVANLLRIRTQDDEGVPTYRTAFPVIPKSPRLRARIWLGQLHRLVDRYVAEQGVPDVVHAHGILWAGVGAVRSRLPGPVPVVITAHSTAFARDLIRPWEEPAIGEALRGADAVLAVSRGLKSQLGRYVPGTEVEVVPNMVDTGFFTLGDRSDHAGFGFLTVALLTEKKGIDILVRAFASAFSANQDVHLRIAGEGPERRTLEELARGLGLDRVQFLGRLSRADVRSEMHRADAFVLPSRVETFGVVLIEAMATGLPVVATRSGGPEDFVYSDVGRLVAPSDPAALAAALVDLHDERRRWSRQAAAIRSYVDERYSERAVTDHIVDIYQRVIEARP